MNAQKVFTAAGYSWGSLNNVSGFVKLSPWGSIVIAPASRLGFVAYSPKAPKRKRSGVMGRLGNFEGTTAKSLKGWLSSLEATDRLRDSWNWGDASEDRTSSMHRRGGAPLHHRGLPHARNKSGRVCWHNR